MKFHSLPVVFSLFFAFSLPAQTPEGAIIAAMKLSENPNYSWNTTVSDDARTYTIEGKTAAGVTWQRQPMPKTVARQLGREAGHELEAIFRSPVAYVMATENGWKLPSELPKRSRDWSDDTDVYYVVAPRLPTPDMPADQMDWDTFGFGLPPAVYVPVVRSQPDSLVYSNYQFALGLPHQELGVIVSSHADLQVDGDTVSGNLNDIGAQLLLVHDGHEYIKPATAAGRFKLWVRNGIVEKYTLELAGILKVRKKTHYVRQQSTTTISGFGATVLDVPGDARQRLW